MFPAAKISASIFRKHNIYIIFLLTIQKPNLIMNKKDYQKPTMKVVQLRHQSYILSASPYETTGTGGTSINAMDDDDEL